MSTPVPLSPGAPAAALLLLADGRFPSGAHAHSGGLEAAVAHGRVADLATLESFLHGRAHTAGAVAAAFAAVACATTGAMGHRPPPGPTPPDGTDRARTSRLADLDGEFEARTPAPALRATSRRLGRQLVRSGCAIRPDPRLTALAATWPRGPHQPIALGVIAGVLGLGPQQAAAAALHDAVTAPATAAVRLLGLDPFAVHALLARLVPRLDHLAEDAARHAHCPAAELPALCSPALDISAEAHATWGVRLFAS